MDEAIDVESGQKDRNPAEHSLENLLNLVSEIQFITLGFLLHLSAFTIIKCELYVARICFQNLGVFLEHFCI